MLTHVVRVAPEQAHAEDFTQWIRKTHGYDAAINTTPMCNSVDGKSHQRFQGFLLAAVSRLLHCHRPLIHLVQLLTELSLTAFSSNGLRRKTIQEVTGAWQTRSRQRLRP